VNTVGQAVGYAGAPPVGLLGVSLGAYLALSVATQEPRVGAVVACSGGLPDAFAERASRMPPTLVLHGEADTVVPVSEARKLERLLRVASPESEVKVYPGQGHVLGVAESLDALGRAVAFFGRHLGRKQAA
jgi:carboxymethylenebutenolidase